MVSIREIRRIFDEVSEERQLPMAAILEFQTRAESLLKDFAKQCDSYAGEGNTRLTKNHVKLAFVDFKDKEEKEDEENEEEFGEWNE
jgi:hypothetical protein|tara:strand:- start:4736 stop:4996 length:261 start_codon:yes stop_codon:yes gene_type:complete